MWIKKILVGAVIIFASMMVTFWSLVFLHGLVK